MSWYVLKRWAPLRWNRSGAQYRSTLDITRDCWEFIDPRSIVRSVCAGRIFDSVRVRVGGRDWWGRGRSICGVVLLHHIVEHFFFRAESTHLALLSLMGMGIGIWSRAQRGATRHRGKGHIEYILIRMYSHCERTYAYSELN